MIYISCNFPRRREHKLKAKDVATVGLFSAFICVATITLKVDIPQTKGYFNVGDSMVFLTALLLGPQIGGLAGGLGSMLADIILGAPWYAPGTLIIKGIEGFTTGKIFNKQPMASKSKTLIWRLIIGFCGAIIALLLYFLGSMYYSVEWQFSPLNITILSLTVTTYVWLVLAIIVAGSIFLAAVRLSPAFGWSLLSCLTGGSFMITGYFLYEYSLLGLGLMAAYEIPFNIGQVVIGSLIALPLYRAISTRARLSSK